MEKDNEKGIIIENNNDKKIIRNYYDRKPDNNFYSTGLAYTFLNKKESLDFIIKQLNKANENINFIKAIKMDNISGTNFKLDSFKNFINFDKNYFIQFIDNNDIIPLEFTFEDPFFTYSFNYKNIYQFIFGTKLEILHAYPDEIN